MKPSVKVYSKDFTLLGILQNATDINYVTKMNGLWSCSFMMPAKDVKNKHCQAFNLIELFDGDKRVDVFRILPSSFTKKEQGLVTYQCEHVLATLMDTVLFGYHQIGNIGVYTPTVLRYIIDRQSLWKLGRCDFNKQFEYKWENENLLAALFSIPQPFVEKYIWTFDTTKKPFIINLVSAESIPSCEIRYKKNMLGITKESDPSNVITRLYCLGYGEGDNQLNIKSVNNGLAYIQAEQQYIDAWGLRESIWIDRRFESADTLKSTGISLLNGLKTPDISYQVSAIDLSKLTESSYDEFKAGKMVHVVDVEDSIEFNAYIVETQKSANKADVQITISNESKDISNTITELQNRARINDAYSQGSTNIYATSFADNADKDNPAILKVFIPNEAVKINKLILNYQLEAFRAYSKSVTTAKQSTQTSSSGGGGSQTSSDGGSDSRTSSSGGGTQTTSGSDNYTSRSGGHNHGISRGTRLLTSDDGYVTWVPSGDHNHDIDIPEHRHYVDIEAHTHVVEIPAHTHNIITPEHGHDMQFGIYRGLTASSAVLKIDGSTVNTNSYEVDLVPYLAKDSSGKITRGTWHTIEIIPNSLSRIVASVFMQTFLNSRGAGDF